MTPDFPITHEFFMKFLENLCVIWGNNCEIAIHDYRVGYDRSVTDIVGNVTDRGVGAPPSSAFLEKIHNDPEEIDKNPVYFTTSEDGKIIKTCSTLVRDAEGNVIGTVCVSLDMSDFLLAQNALQHFTNYKPNGDHYEGNILVKDVNSLTEHYLDMAEKMIGKPMALMNKKEKIRTLAFLNSKGFFKIAKASQILCDAFRVSKFTIYSYLEEAKKSDEFADPAE